MHRCSLAESLIIAVLIVKEALNNPERSIDRDTLGKIAPIGRSYNRCGGFSEVP